MTEKSKKPDMSSYIEDLIFNGYAIKTEELLDGKLKVTYTNLNGNDQLEIENRMKDAKGTPASILHTYQLWILAYTIKQYNDKKPTQGKIDEWFDFIKNLGAVVLDLLISKQGKFEKQLREALMGNEEELENFSPPASTQQD